MKPTFFESPDDFREWLERNHDSAEELVTGLHKTSSGKPSITLREAQDEAICFGWIDGVAHSLDESSYTIRFTPRRRGSVWSAVNIKRAHELIAHATGRDPRSFRAPHGYRNPFVASAARRLAYAVFGWTFGVWDSDPRVGGEEIRARVRRKLKPGAIILLHDGDGYDPTGDRRPTAAALPGIIEDARADGYELRPLGELIP